MLLTVPRKARILLGCMTIATFVGGALLLYPEHTGWAGLVAALALLRTAELVRQIRADH